MTIGKIVHTNLKQSFLIAIIGLFLSLNSYAQTLKKQQYVANYFEQAVVEMLRVGVPASITLAQGVLESTSGTSALAVYAKNHFGIKCGKDWALKDSFLLDDDTLAECFRKYETVLESFHDHSEFLKNRPRYASLFTLDPKDYKAWAYGLKQAGYATNPKYAELLIGIIEDLGLHKYDNFTADSIPRYLVKNDIVLPIPAHQHTHLPPGIQEFNNIKTVLLQPGESIQNIAETYDISIRRLSKYNDLSYPLAEFEPGDKVYLQSKRRKAEVRLDTTGKFETIWDISQEHGVRISSIEKYNHLEDGQQLQAGEIVYLRKKRNDQPEIRTIDDIIELKKLAQEAKQIPVKINNPTEVKKSPPITIVHKNIEPTIETEYIVQAGDTLYKISQKFNISVDNLQQLNGMKDANLKLGQKLKIKN